MWLAAPLLPKVVLLARALDGLAQQMPHIAAAEASIAALVPTAPPAAAADEGVERWAYKKLPSQKWVVLNEADHETVCGAQLAERSGEGGEGPDGEYHQLRLENERAAVSFRAQPNLYVSRPFRTENPFGTFQMTS